MLKRLIAVTGLVIVTTAASAGGFYNRTGQLYDIGKLRIHMACLGTGRPVVIFDSGLGGFSLEWLGIQRSLATEMTTCAYDRAGYGWSDVGPSPRTTSQINDEFVRLLATAGLEPPYILVGHSFGGYNMQYFAKTHPDQVAGVVLLESSHPEQAERIPDVKTKPENVGRSQLFTFFKDPSVLNKYPEDVREVAQMLISSRKGMVAQQRELVNFAYSGSEIAFLGAHFPDVPLVIITRGQRVWPDDPMGKAREDEWQEMQRELSKLNALGQQVIATESGHMIHLDQPELVVNIIREMAHDHCRQATVNTC